ncbi:MAG TPA: hypothetical protein VJ327_02570 [Patescibacteria group bacterium]|nr:hypothetical protein [Patescibacteria group bacterium]
MKKLLTLVLIGLFLGIVPKVWAQGVGSPECLAVQQAAQDAVEAGGPYKNHGQLVKTAAHVVDAAVVVGDIDEECASCIMNQFARGIPIAEQTACGSESEDECFKEAPCSDAEICTTAGDSCEGACFFTAAGNTRCFTGEFGCQEPACTTDADCDVDFACSDTCCGLQCAPLCGPPFVSERAPVPLKYKV